MKCLKNEVDIFILVWQDISNFGESYNPMDDFKIPDFGCEVFLVKYEPQHNGGMSNEILKRNLGIQYAKEEGCTHFLHLDCDEYYEDFGGMKAGDIIETDGELGSVFPAGSFELMEEAALEVATPEPEQVKRGRPAKQAE